jgi:hypothetical protein
MTKRKTLKGCYNNKADGAVDLDNPKWTKSDFSRAKYGNDMPDFIKETFTVRGRPARGS